MPCKEPLRTRKNSLWLYRPCTASFEPRILRTGDLASWGPDQDKPHGIHAKPKRLSCPLTSFSVFSIDPDFSRGKFSVRQISSNHKLCRAWLPILPIR